MAEKFKIKVKRWVARNWGKRCPEYDRECALCKAWKCYDYLFGDG